MTTNKVATQRLLSMLRKVGWQVRPDLKVPEAQLGKKVLYFKSRSIYVEPSMRWLGAPKEYAGRLELLLLDAEAEEV